LVRFIAACTCDSSIATRDAIIFRFASSIFFCCALWLLHEPWKSLFACSTSDILPINPSAGEEEEEEKEQQEEEEEQEEEGRTCGTAIDSMWA
jgi:hypothetical protein